MLWGLRCIVATSLSHSSTLDFKYSLWSSKLLILRLWTFAGCRRLKYVPVEELRIQPGEIMTILMSFSGAPLLLRDLVASLSTTPTLHWRWAKWNREHRFCCPGQKDLAYRYICKIRKCILLIFVLLFDHWFRAKELTFRVFTEVVGMLPLWKMSSISCNSIYLQICANYKFYLLILCEQGAILFWAVMALETWFRIF